MDKAVVKIARGVLLRALRERQGLKQVFLARQLGWHQAALAKAETGDTTDARVQRLCAYWGLTSGEFDALVRDTIRAAEVRLWMGSWDETWKRTGVVGVTGLLQFTGAAVLSATRGSAFWPSSAAHL